MGVRIAAMGTREAPRSTRQCLIDYHFRNDGNRDGRRRTVWWGLTRVWMGYFLLGIAIVGGLLVSQWLTLYTTPVVYLYMDRLSRRLTARASSRNL